MNIYEEINTLRLRAEQAEAALAELQTLLRRIEGTLPADDLRRAFVDGAAWWEFKSTEFTMWNSDRREAEAEAEIRFPGGKARPVGERVLRTRAEAAEAQAYMDMKEAEAINADNVEVLP